MVGLSGVLGVLGYNQDFKMLLQNQMLLECSVYPVCLVYPVSSGYPVSPV